MRLSLVSAAIIGAALAQQPCARVANIVAQNDGIVDADLAMQCLQSVPVDKSGDLAQLKGLLSFVNWQSTLAYLKDPPPGYPFPAVDVLSELQSIQSKVQNDAYDNEFDVQNDILNLWNEVHDGHFVYTPDITQVFVWTRGIYLFSISKDGTSVPQAYASSDVAVMAGQISGHYTPSPITKINGETAETWLQKLANATSYNNHDPDACYNQLFPIIPTFVINQYPNILFSAGSTYQGSKTVLTFANGSTADVPTYAQTYLDWSGVTDGASFFQKFCRGSSASASASRSSIPSASAPVSILPSASSHVISSSAALNKRQASSSAGFSSIAVSSLASASAVPSASGGASSSIPAIADQSTQVSYSAVPSETAIPPPQYYPQSWIASGDRTIACYFPENNDDLAVLSLPSFDPTNYVEFQDTIRQCLATSAKMKKTRLIIDLRGNGGGNVNAAYDFFKQLFPGMVPWGATNFRAWELFKQLTQQITAQFAGTPDNRYSLSQGLNNNFGSVFNADQELNITLKDFESWKAFYGPVQIHDDTFTNLVRYNLSDKFATSGNPISGYGNLEGIVPKQTFAANNIMLLQDGQCASTCTVFSEFMKSQAKVGSVVFGGRAQTGPMQAIGGTKGANDYALSYLLQIAVTAFQAASASVQKAATAQWAEIFLGVQHALDRSPEQTGNINFRNNIREDDKTVTPLQFVYEAADCRLFYTAAQMFNQELVWKAAYASFWNGAACVSGSKNQLSSKPGDSYVLASAGATAVPTTPKSDIVASTSNPAVPMRTAAALAAMVPAFAAGAMLL